MHKHDKDSTESGWEQVRRELSLQEMSSLSDYEETGVDSKIIIGNEGEPEHLLHNSHVRPGPFTAFGKLAPKALNRILKTLKEKYRVEIIILCVRRVR
jgi:hypothetical protein